MRFICFAIFAYMLFGCSDQNNSTPEGVVSVPSSNNRVTLTENEMELAGVVYGAIERRPVSDWILANGKLDVPPQNLITVSAPLGGFVKRTVMLEGMKVKKGDVLAVLENQEYIQLQQDYLDNKSKLEFAESDYSRQKILAEENINAVKSLQQAKSLFESLQAVVSGSRVKLKMIGVDPEQLTNETIRATINIPAPISGYITQMHVNTGQYLNATDPILKMVNTEHLHAELQVYEKDIGRISTGQQVRVQLSHTSKHQMASVYLIGKEIAADRTVRVHCHFEKEDPGRIPGMFVTGKILVTSDSILSVPNNALLDYEGHQYVFIRTKAVNTFLFKEVKTGRSDDAFTEVIEDSIIKQGANIVTDGSSKLLGMLKNTGD